MSQVFGISTDVLLGNSLPEKEAVSHPAPPPVESYIRANFLRRLLTIGWVTTLIGILALLAEYISLFFIRNATVEVNASHGMGYQPKPIYYLNDPPMTYVVTITAVLIILGLIITGLSLFCIVRSFWKKNGKAHKTDA